MAIEARATFMRALENRLQDKLTVKDMDELMETVADVVSDFTLVETPREPLDTGADDLYDAYFSAMKVQGLSEKSLWRYDYVLKRLFKALPGMNSRRITVYHIRKYLQNEKDRGIKDTTLDGIRQVFSAYFGWLHREGLIPIDPTTNIAPIRCPKRLKKAYSDVDIDKINSKAKTPRNKAIVHTLESTGCRISELTGMNKEDVDLDRMEITVIGKGDKERVVYIDEVTCLLIREYLAERLDSSPALFVGCHGERLTPGGVREMLRKVARKAGVEGVHPHRFRRTLATNLNKRGMPVQEIAQVLGHEKIDTTMKYIVMDKQIIKSSYYRYK